MTDEIEKARARLLAMLAQAQGERALLHNVSEGVAVYSKLVDSLTATLHNLPAPAEESPVTNDFPSPP